MKRGKRCHAKKSLRAAAAPPATWPYHAQTAELRTVAAGLPQTSRIFQTDPRPPFTAILKIVISSALSALPRDPAPSRPNSLDLMDENGIGGRNVR